MVKADLQQKATLETMQRLGDYVLEFKQTLNASFLAETDKPNITLAETFENRNGYDCGFLNGWSLPLPMALPEKEGDMLPLKRGGSGVELKYFNFSVIMSASRRLPLLTAVNIDGKDFKKFPRTDSWSYDGRIDNTDQWGNELYNNNILDRGHMVRREDPIWGKNAEQANRDTFHFTNCCPQVAGVNQKTWLGLEDYILNNARLSRQFVTVYTGPFFSDDDLEYRGAKIPLSFWKVVALVTDTGRPSATAYKVSQEKELSQLGFVYGQYKTFQISIKQVMETAGIDFGALLDYDGFSQQERITGKKFQKKLVDLEDILI